MNPFAEQEAWEDHQIRNGILHKITFNQTHHVLLSKFRSFFWMYWYSSLTILQKKQHWNMVLKIKSKYLMIISKLKHHFTITISTKFPSQCFFSCLVLISNQTSPFLILVSYFFSSFKLNKFIWRYFDALLVSWTCG